MNIDKYKKNEYFKSAGIKSPFYEIELTDNVKQFIDNIVMAAVDSDQRIQSELAYDIGAYVGSSVPRLKAMGFNKITCFEADPDIFSQLKQHYGSDSNVEVVNVAISNFIGTITLHRCDRGRSFLNTMSPDWIFNTRHKELVTNLSKVDVSCVTLDDYLSNNKTMPAYVKIDVEGHELEVLNSMSFRPAILSFEWISELLDKNVTCLERAHKLGFNFFNVSTREEEVLGPNDKWMTLQDASHELKIIKEGDVHNNIWGNAWCIKELPT